MTLHEALEWLAVLARRPGRVGMASRCRSVDEKEAEESEACAGPRVPIDPLTDLLVEMRALRGLVVAAFGAAGPRVWTGGQSGGAPGGGVVVRF